MPALSYFNEFPFIRSFSVSVNGWHISPFLDGRGVRLLRLLGPLPEIRAEEDGDEPMDFDGDRILGIGMYYI